jgi:hypothetical protein
MASIMTSLMSLLPPFEGLLPKWLLFVRPVPLSYLLPPKAIERALTRSTTN